jgi:2-hydroxychromene-2-carboxylate isomerase
MTERIRFYFDPICPWCYQTSRWLKRVAELGEAGLSWGLFSLELQNAGNEPEELARAHARSTLALSTTVAVRDAAGSDAVGAFYGALGRRVHEGGEALEDPTTVKAALDDVGLDPGLAGLAGGDSTYADRVADEHRQLVDRTRSFGVPTIVLDDGEGPAIFGPVITEPPADDGEGVELFRHVVWLARHDNFAELKRERDRLPDLESVRRWKRRQ